MITNDVHETMRNRVVRAIEMINLEATPIFMTYVPTDANTLLSQADKILAAIADSQPRLPEPPWEDAPEKALYAALDPEMLEWMFSEDELKVSEIAGGWSSPSGEEYWRTVYEYVPVKEPIPLGIDWRMSLRKRPEITDDKG